jgi:hypothetical protein
MRPLVADGGMDGGAAPAIRASSRAGPIFQARAATELIPCSQSRRDLPESSLSAALRTPAESPGDRGDRGYSRPSSLSRRSRPIKLSKRLLGLGETAGGTVPWGESSDTRQPPMMTLPRRACSTGGG